MDNNQLESLVRQFGIAKDQILREEAEMFFLDELAKDKLAAKVAFYGGTALRLAYNCPRFSEDIDLIKLEAIKFSEFEKFVRKIVKKNENWKLADLKNKRNTMFALFQIKEEKLKHNFSLKIELYKPAKKIKLEMQLTLIKSPASLCEPLLLVPTLAELKRMKEDAILGRKKARDIFDLWFISQALRLNFELPEKLPVYLKKEFENELKVFLPKKFYPVVTQLYAKIKR
ncbi:MAG: nucleotidyl transferase AbiEii/AbiGii toxin family protein [Candidatus Moraniibacteriota bacterium]